MRAHFPTAREGNDTLSSANVTGASPVPSDQPPPPASTSRPEAPHPLLHDSPNPFLDHTWTRETSTPPRATCSSATAVSSPLSLSPLHQAPRPSGSPSRSGHSAEAWRAVARSSTHLNFPARKRLTSLHLFFSNPDEFDPLTSNNGDFPSRRSLEPSPNSCEGTERKIRHSIAHMDQLKSISPTLLHGVLRWRSSTSCCGHQQRALASRRSTPIDSGTFCARCSWKAICPRWPVASLRRPSPPIPVVHSP